MKEKEKIKVSLGVAVCIVIIVLLIIGIIIAYYSGYVKGKETNKEMEQKTKQVEEKIDKLIKQNEEKNKINDNSKNISIEENNNLYQIKETTNNNNLLSSSEIQKILGPDDAMFCIENIEKSGNDYIITAYILEKKSRIISKAEYEKILNGGEIEFRNLKWKKDTNTQMQDELRKGIFIESGNNSLFLNYDKQKEEGTLENIAGAASGGLRDYSENLIKFKVSKDILIGGMIFTQFKYDNNGKIKIYQDQEEVTNFESMSFDKLLNKAKTRTGTYQECKVLVKNGKVDAIQIMED